LITGWKWSLNLQHKLDTITRRKFFCALAASAIAIGVPLPIGMDKVIKTDAFNIIWTACGNTPSDLMIVGEYVYAQFELHWNAEGIINLE